MELITSLILLVVLLAPPFWLAGREIMEIFFINGREALSGTSRAVTDPQDSDGWETPPVYDGMITIEIPAPRDEIIAYEPLLDDGEIALLDFPSRASRA